MTTPKEVKGKPIKLGKVSKETKGNTGPWPDRHTKRADTP